jgi:uncharacterized membrane protein
MKSKIVWLILCGIWGSTWLFIKIGLEDLPPLSFAALRFVIAAAILWAIVAVRRFDLPRAKRDWLMLAGTGVLAFTVNYGLVFWGEQFISSGLAALLQATIPAFGLLLAHLHLPAERMTLPKVLGVLLGVIGVGVIFSNQLSVAGPQALAGCVALVVSAAGAAYSNVLIKAHGGKFDTYPVVGPDLGRESALLWLDRQGRAFIVLSGDRRLSNCFHSLLLAGPTHGCDQEHDDSPGDTSDGGDFGNDCFGRAVRLADTSRRRAYFERHRHGGCSPTKEGGAGDRFDRVSANKLAKLIL